MNESDTYQLGVSNQLTSKPEEGLLEVVVGLGGDIVVLEVLLAVEGDSLGLHLTLLNVDLVTGEDNRDTLADTDEITWQGRRGCQQLKEQQGMWSTSTSEEQNLRCQLGTFL